MIRSFLFVPADSERKLGKAVSLGADALIVDLEDSVQPQNRVAARHLAHAFVAENRSAWVRINPLDSADAALDLAAVLPAAPAGIVLPKPRSAAATVELDRRLSDLEREHGIEPGSTAILPLCTEHPQALLTLHGYVDASPRLYGLTWGAEDLSAALGAATNKAADGSWLPPYELARSLCLIAASAAEVHAVDTVFTDVTDVDGIAAYAARARRDGFTGMLAIHPGQVEIINAAFSIDDNERARAQQVVDLFAANPDAGVLTLEGQMLDRPHLVRARKILGLGGRD